MRRKQDDVLTPWWSAAYAATVHPDAIPVSQVASLIAHEAMLAIRLWSRDEIEGDAPRRRGKPYHPTGGSYYPYVPSGYLADLLHNAVGVLGADEAPGWDHRHADGSRLTVGEYALIKIVAQIPRDSNENESGAQMRAWVGHVIAQGGWTVEGLHAWASTIKS